MHKIQTFILNNIEKNPQGISKLVMDEFGVTRGAVHFHLNKLKERNLIIQKGDRNKAEYFLAKKDGEIKGNEKNKKGITFHYTVGEVGEYEIWTEDIKRTLGKLSPNVEDICRHGFTEMYNNVIDHSGSKMASVDIVSDDENVEIAILDYGIGVFKKIAEYFKIEDLRDALVRLHQGKLTTDRSRHSGEGIFFTSRAFDKFIILANGFCYYKSNDSEDDWYFERNVEKESGTYVKMTISKKSNRDLQEVFNQYTNPDDFRFDRSHMRIELAKYEEDKFVSRSQAKRLLAGLKDFRTIILDFKNIKGVGQAFVDEIFGVFGTENAGVKFQINNANEDVLFMLKRGITERKFPLNRVTGL